MPYSLNVVIHAATGNVKYVNTFKILNIFGKDTGFLVTNVKIIIPLTT